MRLWLAVSRALTHRANGVLRKGVQSISVSPTEQHQQASVAMSPHVVTSRISYNVELDRYLRKPQKGGPDIFKGESTKLDLKKKQLQPQDHCSLT